MHATDKVDDIDEQGYLIPYLDSEYVCHGEKGTSLTYHFDLASMRRLRTTTYLPGFRSSLSPPQMPRMP